LGILIFTSSEILTKSLKNSIGIQWWFQIKPGRFEMQQIDQTSWYR